MSLTQKRYAPHGSATTARHAASGEARARLAGALILASGLLLAAPAVAEALAAGVAGSERGEVLHGSESSERVTGLGGGDELYGAEGSDGLFSGSGDDFVEASDGERDLVSCGLGEDVASVDFVDLVASDCERVYPG